MADNNKHFEQGVIDFGDQSSHQNKILPDFNGSDYSSDHDKERLSNQLNRVFNIMKDGSWRSLTEIHDAIWAQFGIRDNTSSISAQLRNLRKQEFGGHTITKKAAEESKRENGLFIYHLSVKK